MQQYVQQPSETPFDLKSVPIAPVIEERLVAPNGQLDGGSTRATPNVTATPAATRLPATANRQDVYIEKLSSIPQFASFGPLFKSSAPTELTESETEYVVRCVKHTYSQHIVLQVRNDFLFFLVNLNILNIFPFSSLIALILWTINCWKMLT